MLIRSSDAVVKGWFIQVAYLFWIEIFNHESYQRRHSMPMDIHLSSIVWSSSMCGSWTIQSYLSLPLSLFSQGYHLQTTRDMRPHPSVTLDPASFHPPPFRSRNQSYMRAVSTLSQASCVSQVSLKRTHGTEATSGDMNDSLWYVVVCGSFG